jgi:transposase
MVLYNGAMKCKRDSDGRQLDHVALQTMRVQAVKAVKNGQTVQSVADALGVNVRSVFRWLADFASGGQKALQAKPIPGRPALLGNDEMRWVANAVKSGTPQQFKFEYALWTLAIIGELIERRFGKHLSRGSVGRVMRLLGFTPQRPLYRAAQRDEVLVERWQSEEYPRIAAEAKRVGATIYFQDESSIRSDYHTGTTWAPSANTPVVEATGRRFSLSMLSAVSKRGDFRFMVHEGTVNAQVFREFLKRLMANPTQPIFLVVDGHPMHKAKLVRQYVEAQEGRLRLFFLPPYSPHLNPDEQVWKHVKAGVAKRLVTSKEDLKDKLNRVMRRLQKLRHIVQGFFRHPHCQYI